MRRVHLGGWIEAPVWRFEALAEAQVVAGTALIESPTTTILLRPGDRARFDGRGWLELDVAASPMHARPDERGIAP
jgi:N-methylhydantoinase A